MTSPTRLLLAGLTLALLSGGALALLVLPSAQAPLPSRPFLENAVDITNTTTSVRTEAVTTSERVSTGGVAQLKSGLDALSDKNLSRARAVRDSFPVDSLDRHILAWAIAFSGGKGVPSSEIAAAAYALAGWPGMEALRKNSERAMLREDPAAAHVVQAFGSSLPQTIEGAVMLARAHLALADAEAASAVLDPFWRREKLDAAEETAIIREFGKVIPTDIHRIRMEQMLYEERANSAERVAGLAGGRELAKAWAAVLRKEKNAAALLDAVPKAQRTAGWYYAKAKHLRWRKKYAQASEVVLQAPQDAASLVDPDAWWIERRVLARELLDQGDAKSAYRLTAAHAAQSPIMAVDAEFHAGWLALRSLNDPGTASRHFARIAGIADGPISRSRAAYWLGRAAEAGGSGDARAHYEKAAAYGASFYGQLAAAKLGRGVIAAADPAPTDPERATFASREAVQAIRRLEEAGYGRRADRLYRDLAAELDSAGELALLARMAEKRGNHYLALRVGKIAASRGLDIGGLAHPTGAIPASADISGAGEALAYAIARQESEFNVSAVSGAGARGLLQLLPGTARDMARRTGLKYSQARLTTDAGYNATLGTAYLNDQLGRFDGSYVLTFAGYNAGPRRAQEWIKRYGDPRGKDIDLVVDWIERIPFSETRDYVQRVMENYQVYKMRLSGEVDIAADLVHGRRHGG